MPPTANRADLLPTGWPTLVIAALALGILALWLLSLWAKKFFAPRPLPRALAFLIRTALACSTLWLFFQLLARAVYLATPWLLLPTAAIAAIAIELATLLYDRERRLVPKSVARILIALRITAFLTLTLILLQPVLAIESQRRLRREIVILLDDSASMQLSDKQLTPSEKLKLAALAGVDAAQRDFTLTGVSRGLQLLDSQLAAEARALEPPAGVSTAAANSLISRRTQALEELFEDAQKRITTFVATIKQARNSQGGQEASPLENLEDRISQNLSRGLTEAQKNLAAANFPATLSTIQNINRQISYILEQLPPIIEQYDRTFYEALPASDRQLVDKVVGTTRAAIARQALNRNGFIEKLGDDYLLRFIRFGRRPADVTGSDWLQSGDIGHLGEDESAFRHATDFTTALESVIETVPASSLAGILVLSDGRHNGERPIEDIARRLGIQQTPVCSVVIGSSIGPVDTCILDVRVPEVIYLDDAATINADLKLDGLLGQTVTVSLLKGNQLLESKEIEVGDSSMRTTVRFTHTPDQIGISNYTVHTSLSPGEIFPDNNRWDFDVAVTDDRTNVLIIESYPRWEFRYLRNLFHARDKSVNLQYVLLNPDSIADTPPPPEAAASADRKFGDSEATALPADREHWLKFDAIILGDIPPSAIDDTTWDVIRHCVSERGALLVTIAGQRHMPHAHTSSILRELLPITFDAGAENPEPAYRLRLTPAGRDSLIMQQSPDPNLNEMVWGSLPPLHWRSPITGVKPGAEVLAYAHPLGSSDSRTPTSKLQSARALIVTQRYAAGRVVTLNFDRTWRLRYGVGDVHHHKFWGQMLRWGTGENLRAGNEFIRLGTDKLSYEPGERVRVTARHTPEYRQPTSKSELSAAVYQDDTLIVRRPLTFRLDSNGVFETELPAPPGTGKFQVRVESSTTSLSSVETEFTVEPSRNAIELSELTADPRFLGRLAALTGGSIADPDNASALRKFFAPPGQIIRERSETSLWDNFPLLIVFLALLTTEWITRRRSGLA